MTDQLQLPKDPREARELLLQFFANLRQNPTMVLIISSVLQSEHVLQVRNLLRNQEFEKLDVVIVSNGGHINAAYQIVKLLQRHAKHLTACVPLYAKSAATLITIGCDEIRMDAISELGPLDAQILEEDDVGEAQFASALNPFKGIEQLQQLSLEQLDLAVKMIMLRSGLKTEPCVKHAIQFVEATVAPLFGRLNPDRLGSYSRGLIVGKRYAEHVLKRVKPTKKIEDVAHDLVYGYPSHDFVIGCSDLRGMGLNAHYFDDREQIGVDALIGAAKIAEQFEDDVIQLILPQLEQPDEEKDQTEATPGVQAVAEDGNQDVTTTVPDLQDISPPPEQKPGTSTSKKRSRISPN